MCNIKSQQEIKNKLKEFVDANNKRTWSSPYNERVISILKYIDAGYNEDDILKLWEYYKTKYGPYINYVDRKEAKDKADKFLEENLKKTKNKEKREQIWQEYERINPPEYDEYKWKIYDVLEYICEDKELIGPL